MGAPRRPEKLSSCPSAFYHPPSNSLLMSLVAIFVLAGLIVFCLSLFIPNIYIHAGGGHLEKCFGMNDHCLHLLASFHVDFLGGNLGSSAIRMVCPCLTKTRGHTGPPRGRQMSGSRRHSCRRGSGCFCRCPSASPGLHKTPLLSPRSTV